jgi:penicillin-binding protein 1B
MCLGLDNVSDAIHLLGYQKDIRMRPSILLGSINMSPMEINQLYLPFAAQGMFKKTHAINKIVSAQGDILWRFKHKKEQRLSNNGAYLIDYALAQVAQSGTAKSLTWRLKNTTVAGKTGTSNNLRDSWFVGYDNKHLVTTWLGKDNNKPTGLTGSSGALPLFARFMKAQGLASKDLAMPDGISMTLFEKKTGSAVTAKCEGTISYPAVNSSIRLAKGCLEEKNGVRYWFERIFGD